jgi:hypothetical protein
MNNTNINNSRLSGEDRVVDDLSSITSRLGYNGGADSLCSLQTRPHVRLFQQLVAVIRSHSQSSSGRGVIVSSITTSNENNIAQTSNLVYIPIHVSAPSEYDPDSDGPILNDTVALGTNLPFIYRGSIGLPGSILDNNQLISGSLEIMVNSRAHSPPGDTPATYTVTVIICSTNVNAPLTVSGGFDAQPSMTQQVIFPEGISYITEFPFVESSTPLVARRVLPDINIAARTSSAALYAIAYHYPASNVNSSSQISSTVTVNFVGSSQVASFTYIPPTIPRRIRNQIMHALNGNIDNANNNNKFMEKNIDDNEILIISSDEGKEQPVFEKIDLSLAFCTDVTRTIDENGIEYVSFNNVNNVNNATEETPVCDSEKKEKVENMIIVEQSVGEEQIEKQNEKQNEKQTEKETVGTDQLIRNNGGNVMVIGDSVFYNDVQDLVNLNKCDARVEKILDDIETREQVLSGWGGECPPDEHFKMNDEEEEELFVYSVLKQRCAPWICQNMYEVLNGIDMDEGKAHKEMKIYEKEQDDVLKGVGLQTVVNKNMKMNKKKEYETKHGRAYPGRNRLDPHKDSTESKEIKDLQKRGDNLTKASKFVKREMFDARRDFWRRRRKRFRRSYWYHQVALALKYEWALEQLLTGNFADEMPTHYRIMINELSELENARTHHFRVRLQQYYSEENIHIKTKYDAQFAAYCDANQTTADGADAILAERWNKLMHSYTGNMKSILKVIDEKVEGDTIIVDPSFDYWHLWQRVGSIPFGVNPDDMYPSSFIDINTLDHLNALGRYSVGHMVHQVNQITSNTGAAGGHTVFRLATGICRVFPPVDVLTLNTDYITQVDNLKNNIARAPNATVSFLNGWNVQDIIAIMTPSVSSTNGFDSRGFWLKFWLAYNARSWWVGGVTPGSQWPAGFVRCGSDGVNGIAGWQSAANITPTPNAYAATPIAMAGGEKFPFTGSIIDMQFCASPVHAVGSHTLLYVPKAIANSGQPSKFTALWYMFCLSPWPPTIDCLNATIEFGNGTVNNNVFFAANAFATHVRGSLQGVSLILPKYPGVNIVGLNQAQINAAVTFVPLMPNGNVRNIAIPGTPNIYNANEFVRAWWQVTTLADLDAFMVLITSTIFKDVRNCIWGFDAMSFFVCRTEQVTATLPGAVYDTVVNWNNNDTSLAFLPSGVPCVQVPANPAVGGGGMFNDRVNDLMFAVPQIDINMVNAISLGMGMSAVHNVDFPMMLRNNRFHRHALQMNGIMKFVGWQVTHQRWGMSQSDLNQTTVADFAAPLRYLWQGFRCSGGDDLKSGFWVVHVRRAQTRFFGKVLCSDPIDGKLLIPGFNRGSLRFVGGQQFETIFTPLADWFVHQLCGDALPGCMREVVLDRNDDNYFVGEDGASLMDQPNQIALVPKKKFFQMVLDDIDVPSTRDIWNWHLLYSPGIYDSVVLCTVGAGRIAGAQGQLCQPLVHINCNNIQVPVAQILTRAVFRFNKHTMLRYWTQSHLYPGIDRLAAGGVLALGRILTGTRTPIPGVQVRGTNVISVVYKFPSELSPSFLNMVDISESGNGEMQEQKHSGESSPKSDN